MINAKKILFIEDEKEFAHLISSHLRKRGFAVTHISQGRDGLRRLQKKSYDLVILDLVLTGTEPDGLLLCKKIRERTPIPILVLSARDNIEDKVLALNSGADDYLVKPASIAELIARVDKLIKKGSKYLFRSAVFQFNKIKFNTVSGILTFKDKSVSLTKREKMLLEYLVLKKGQVLTNTEILEHVWGKDIDFFSNIVNVSISSLRKKLRQITTKKLIYTIHGLGYKFETDE